MASHTTPATSNDYSSFSSYSGPQPFVGIVENTIEAMHLVYAASKGIVPRTTRRLASNAERRNLIKSGAVFIFSVKESGIRRWTDGRQWSASRVAGNFLLYRELAEKKSNVKDFDRFEELILADGVVYSDAPNRYASSSRKSVASTGENNVQKLKDDGLRKKTITIKINDVDFHLICYYTQRDRDNGILPRLSSHADITALVLEPEAFNFDDFRYPPKVIVAADGGPPIIICESDPVDSAEDSDVVEDPQDSQYNNHPISLTEPETLLPNQNTSSGPGLQEGGSSMPNDKSPGMIHQPGYDDIQQPGHDESGPGILSGNTWGHNQSISQILPTFRAPDQYSSDYVDWNSLASSTHPRYQHIIDRYTNLSLSPAQPTHSPGYDEPGYGREGSWHAAQGDVDSYWHEGQMEGPAPYGSQEAQQFGRENVLGLPYQNSNPVLAGPNLDSGQYIPASATENYLSLQQPTYHQEYYGALPSPLEHYSGHSNRGFQDEDEDQDGYDEYR